jgi:tetratricopeptide (TPR) repeat protein
MDPTLRREALARRLLGGRGGASMPPPVRPSTTPTAFPAITTAEAMESLRRRYEERVAAARNAEARKYAARAEEAARSNQLVAAARAFEVASGLVPEDDDLKRKAATSRAEADSVLGETYRRQAEYEEKSGQWAAAARSWAAVCKAFPDDADAIDRAASAMVRAGGDLGGAIRLAERACRLNPSRVASRITLGKLYLAASRSLDAKRELEAAARLDPRDGAIQEMLKKAGKPG